ncbi:uncharacterized protein [Miscanthus floridulus]|uniref:uncharacterized protein n=1 Tax=Miscanthus floridulus TaxID=154761 RepID=UPI0034576301
MDSALLEVLVEHHNHGNHAQNGWKPHVYSAAIRNVQEKCNVDITKENITSRCKTFDKHYEVISKILAQSGFGWDWENRRLSIDSDDVWSKYVEANKSAACYKTKVVKNWDAISTIYSKDHATSQAARTGVESAQEMANGTDPNSNEGSLESPTVPSQLGKRPRTGETLVSLFGDIKASFDSAMKSTEPVELPKATSPREIFKALDKISDLGCDDYLRAYGMMNRDD